MTESSSAPVADIAQTETLSLAERAEQRKKRFVVSFNFIS